MISVLTIKGIAASVAIGALTGCAGLGRTRPQDMTVPQHEQAAREDFRKFAEASAAARAGGRTASYERMSAQHHRNLANEHAAAAAVRRKEVDAICAEATRTHLHEMIVANVDPIIENDVPKHLRHPRGYYPERLKGARIALKVDEGDQRIAASRSVQCEAALASAGIEPVNAASPFAVRGAKAAVRVQDPGIVVEVRSDERDAASVLDRASALAQVAH